MKASSREVWSFSSTSRLHDSSARADLHTHSTWSDGLLSPSALVAEAAARGVGVLALTDHDTVAGIPEARSAAADHGVEVIPGVELSAALPDGRDVHLLGYFVDIDDSTLLNALSGYTRARELRVDQIVDRLRRIGAPVAGDRVRELSWHGTLGRPHVAHALVEAGHASDLPDAFARYLGAGKPAFVSRPRVDPREAIAVIRAAGGVPVLAHPFSTGGVEDILDRLITAGLAGIEVDYGEYTREERETLREIASRRRLIATGGSDYHGPDRRASRELGMVSVSPEAVSALRSAAHCPSPIALGEGVG